MTLAGLGWRESFAQHLPHDNPELIPSRVALVHRDRYVLYGADRELDAILSGSFARAIAGGADRPVTGDWVLVRATATEGLVRIHQVLPRLTAFARKPPIGGGRKLIRFEGESRFGGGDTLEQVVAANMDFVAIVTSLDGDFSIPRLRRYLITTERSGAKPLVVLNKSDLTDPGPASAELSRFASGIPVLPLSARTGAGLGALEPFLEPGRTIAFLGSSGVGKSSLINALLGEDRQYVSAKSHSSGKGRHTTSRRELVPLPGGAFLLDTPGMREIQLWADGSDIALAFEGLEALALDCRFPDCRHGTEPGCAVQRAIAEGQLAPEVLEQYRILAREVRYLALRRQERLRTLARKGANTVGQGTGSGRIR
jgi:ribosome biogenesis GTPase / thiamine phosphate phosphatase